MRLVRQNPERDENSTPVASDCIAHRCQAHAELPPVDDSADDSAECSICVAQKFILAHEEALEEDVMQKLVWPAIDKARDRLNLLGHGAGDQFVEEIREWVTAYRQVTKPIAIVASQD